MERYGARLVIRLVNVGRDMLLLLEEPATRSNWLRLAPLGLPPREARVLLECLREEVVAAGARMPPDAASRVIAWFREVQSLATAAYRLTPHELRLLGLLVEGHSYKTAAAGLGSSIHSLSIHSLLRARRTCVSIPASLRTTLRHEGELCRSVPPASSPSSILNTHDTPDRRRCS